MKKNPALITFFFAFVFVSTVERIEAFHDGGVGSCEGCHSTHREEASEAANNFLRGSDPGSTCLRCHSESFKVLSDNGSAYTPGGDFFWLRRDYPESAGDRHGHNIVAVDYNLGIDPTLNFAPGAGSSEYRSEWLSCISCHDPHGRVSSRGSMPVSASGSFGGIVSEETVSGSYRLLGGAGYKGGGTNSDFQFVNPAPVARASWGGGEEWPAERDGNHVDYGSGMSEWCINCHSGFSSSGGQHGHPSGADALMGEVAKVYNSYIASGKLGGSRGSAYDHFVPFERGETDPGRLDPLSSEGPDAKSNVMCLTCHRAHASPFKSIGRWDFQSTFLAESAVLKTPDGIHAYYGEDIAQRYHPYQRSLCNKCHLQD